MHVAKDGRLTIDTANVKEREIGRIHLATFAAPEGLRQLGDTVFAATYESGPERRIEAGRENGPTITFGMLERSNVSIIESMMQILTAQRGVHNNADSGLFRTVLRKSASKFTRLAPGFANLPQNSRPISTSAYALPGLVESTSNEGPRIGNYESF